ncbi:MBL fold metallo-hydrolase [Roseomonas frigidaquae]|uniref:MBL fold metallo-hydrolase n=1 Tax=Falsiroseomonas frigidaquae TaxID=487318 RepID=A0ABX1EW59_9PROT|nr:MBL fold metallo-hydrolase [Falsiroseomonas frigidaquae]NKE43864.1 MBL fold metallo-hydrolase [Falsiroseomonas frigidaquae]
MHRTNLPRRFMLLGTLAGAAALASDPAPAAVPRATGQAPGFYRHRVGEIEVTALLDGNLAFPDAALPNLFRGYDPAIGSRLRTEAFDAPGGVPLAVNAFLVNTGTRLILVDAGAAAALGPTLGQIPGNLRAAGVELADIDAIVLTHLHRDHAAGLLTADGAALFPRAELLVAEAEAAYWSDPGEETRAPAPLRPFFAPARAVLAAYGNRVRRIGVETEVAPGIRTMAIPGHTPGHLGVHVASGNAQFLIWGDVVHAQSLQFARPDWSISFDSDPDLAARTRSRIFDMAATDRIVIAGSHLAFPAIGHVARRSEGYGFVPAMWRSPL